MPKSKKPRHAHRRKFTYSTIWLPEEQINAIKNLFLHAEMIAEIKLVRGMCTYDDVACMRDTMNFCSWYRVRDCKPFGGRLNITKDDHVEFRPWED